jgi:hypothetical protein
MLRIAIISQRPVPNLRELQTLLKQIAAALMTPDDRGAWVCPESDRFAMTVDGRHVSWPSTKSDTTITIEHFKV